MLEAIRRIEKYTIDLSQMEFVKNELVQDAVIKNLEIIGEAAYKIDSESKQQFQNIEWKKIEGLRHRLVHDYYEIDMLIIWNTIKNRIPQLREDILLVKSKIK